MKPTAISPSKEVDEKVPLPQVVTVPVPDATTVQAVQEKPKWSWCHLVWSLIATLFSGLGASCGLIGLVHSILSYVDHRSAAYRRSAKKRRCAWGWTITALVLGLVFWGMAIYCSVHWWKRHHTNEIDLGGMLKMMAMKHGEYEKMNDFKFGWKPTDKKMFGGDDHDKVPHGKKVDKDFRDHHNGRHGDHDSDSGDRDHDDDEKRRHFPTHKRPMP